MNKKYIAISNRNREDGNLIDYSSDDIFLHLNDVPAINCSSRIDSVLIKKDIDNNIISFVITQKEFNKNFKIYKAEING